MKKRYIILVASIILFILGISNNINSSEKEKKYLVPMGNIIGISANTEGVLILDSEGYIGGIRSGDSIVSIEGINVNSNQDVKKILNKCKKNYVDAVINRDGGYFNKKLKVNKINGEYKLGIWIRDKISGIGTMTFYDPESSNFGALGHAIKDKDINELIKVKSGKIYNAKDTKILKGKDGYVGHIKADFSDEKHIGYFDKNNKFGINGKLTTYDNSRKYNMIEVGNKKEIQTGKANILFQNESGEVEKYDVNIKKVNYTNKNDGKDMVIEVTDERLINYTGGIVQGMSGAPIIQNNKIIGALTHVFLDNSKIGYGIFIDKMII